MHGGVRYLPRCGPGSNLPARRPREPGPTRQRARRGHRLDPCWLPAAVLAVRRPPSPPSQGRRIGGRGPPSPAAAMPCARPPAVALISNLPRMATWWPLTSRPTAFAGPFPPRHRTEGCGNAGLRRSCPLHHRVPAQRDVHRHQRGFLPDESHACRAGLPCPAPRGRRHELVGAPAPDRPPLTADHEAAVRYTIPSEGDLRRQQCESDR